MKGKVVGTSRYIKLVRIGTPADFPMVSLGHKQFSATLLIIFATKT